MHDSMNIDLSNIDLADIDTLNAEGKGLPEFAASCGTNCNTANACSCTVQQERPSAPSNQN
ncbi:MAG: hypothetical protein AAGC60_20640 [Acidobacteriota bacterium]